MPVMYTPVSTIGALLCDWLWPWLTNDLAIFLDAIGIMLDPVYTLVADQGVDDGSEPTVGTYVNGTLVPAGGGFQAGYASALDPQQATCGYGYLAQFVGVQLPIGVDAATAKSLVLAEGGMSRGTTAAMVAAAQRFLTGSQSVAVIERTAASGAAAAGWFLMVVQASQVTSAAGLTAAVDAVKFGGLQWALIQTSGWIVSQLETTYSTIAAVEGTFATVNAVEGDVT